MIFWILYFGIDGDFSTSHPYHFASKETCVQIGQSVVSSYKGYESFRCVQEHYVANKGKKK